MRYIVLLDFIQEYESLDDSTKRGRGPYKDDYESALSEFVEELDRRRQNTEKLSDAKALLTAEFYRRKKRFNEAIDLLKSTSFMEEENKRMAQCMISRAEHGNTEVFILEDEEKNVVDVR